MQLVATPAQCLAACLLLVWAATLIEASEGIFRTFTPPSSGAGNVDALMRDSIAGVAEVTFSPQNDLSRTLDYLVTSVMAFDRLLRTEVPELKVPQVAQLLAAVADTSKPAIATLLEANLLLEQLIGPSSSSDSEREGLEGSQLPYAADWQRGTPSGFPITRRALMAWAARLHLGGHQWSEEEADLLLRAARYLHRLHRTAAEAKHVLEFFHTSKAGGSSLCQLGVANGCTTQNSSMRENCMIKEFRDFPRWTSPGALPGLLRTPWCARFGIRRGEMQWNFYANEYVMHLPRGMGLWPESFREARPCAEFLYVMTFRDPKARLVSHLQNVLREYTFIPPNSPPPTPVAAASLPTHANLSTKSFIGRLVAGLNATHGERVSPQADAEVAAVQQDSSSAARKLTQHFRGLIGGGSEAGRSSMRGEASAPADMPPARATSGGAGVASIHLVGEEQQASMAAPGTSQAATAGGWLAPPLVSIPEAFFSQFNPLNATAWQELAAPVVDNYVLRTLLGETMYMAPLHSLTSMHLAVGKLVTLQLDVLLTLELPALNAASFEMGLGWTSGFEQVHARQADTQKTGAAALPSSAQLLGALAPLLSENSLDRSLYEFAAVAQVMDSLAWGLTKVALPEDALALLDARRQRHQCGYVGSAGRRRRKLRMQHKSRSFAQSKARAAA